MTGLDFLYVPESVRSQVRVLLEVSAEIGRGFEIHLAGYVLDWLVSFFQQFLGDVDRVFINPSGGVFSSIFLDHCGQVFGSDAQLAGIEVQRPFFHAVFYDQLNEVVRYLLRPGVVQKCVRDVFEVTFA